MDDLNGLSEFRGLLDDGEGLIQFYALIEEDIDYAHGHARVLYSRVIFEEMITLKPKVMSDRAAAAALMRAEEDRGLLWAA
jgi:hypothetical protein